MVDVLSSVRGHVGGFQAFAVLYSVTVYGPSGLSLYIGSGVSREESRHTELPDVRGYMNLSS